MKPTPIFRQALIVERKSAPPADGALAEPNPYTFDVVASDESLDAFGTILRGWRLERFAQNPIVLHAHDHTEPVGQASNVALADGALRMTITLAEEGTSPVVDKVRSLRRQGILRGVSVGCLPGGLAIEKAADGSDVMVLSDNELLELSVCAVPANPNALAELRTLALSTRTPRPPMSTAKKPATRAPSEGDPKPADPPAEKPIAKEEPVQKDAAGDAEHQVYVDHMAMAVSEMTSLDDAQRTEVQAAIDKHLAAAKEEVDAMEPAEDPAVAEASVRHAGAMATVERLSKELGEARTALSTAELRAEKVERDAIIERAKADRQWSPALAPFLAGLPLAQLREWKKSAPAVVPGGEVAPPAEATSNDRQLPVGIAAIVARAKKDGWKSLSTRDKDSITRHDGALAQRLATA